MKLTELIPKTPMKNKKKSLIAESNKLNQRASMEVTTWLMRRIQMTAIMMISRCLRILKMNEIVHSMEMTILCLVRRKSNHSKQLCP